MTYISHWLTGTWLTFLTDWQVYMIYIYIWLTGTWLTFLTGRQVYDLHFSLVDRYIADISHQKTGMCTFLTINICRKDYLWFILVYVEKFPCLRQWNVFIGNNWGQLNQYIIQKKLYLYSHQRLYKLLNKVSTFNKYRRASKCFLLPERVGTRRVEKRKLI